MRGRMYEGRRGVRKKNEMFLIVVVELVYFSHSTVGGREAKFIYSCGRLANRLMNDPANHSVRRC